MMFRRMHVLPTPRGPVTMMEGPDMQDRIKWCISNSCDARPGYADKISCVLFVSGRLSSTFSSSTAVQLIGGVSTAVVFERFFGLGFMPNASPSSVSLASFLSLLRFRLSCSGVRDGVGVGDSSLSNIFCLLGGVATVGPQCSVFESELHSGSGWVQRLCSSSSPSALVWLLLFMVLNARFVVIVRAHESKPSKTGCEERMIRGGSRASSLILRVRNDRPVRVTRSSISLASPFRSLLTTKTPCRYLPAEQDELQCTKLILLPLRLENESRVPSVECDGTWTINKACTSRWAVAGG